MITAYSSKALHFAEIFPILFILSLLIFSAFLLLLWRHRKKVREKDAELRYQDQLFNIIVNNTNDVFLMLRSNDCTLEYASPNFERVLGLKPTEIDNNLAELDIPDFAQGHESVARALRNLGQSSSISLEGAHINPKTGEKRWFIKTIFRAKIDNAERFIIIFSDRTRERESYDALEAAVSQAKIADAAKSAFLSNMSHDIRTPMNAIVGFAVLLEKNAANTPRVLEYTRKILDSSRHLLNLINDVLDKSKIESGKTIIKTEEFTLSEIITSLDNIIRPQAQAKNQTLTITARGIWNENLLGDKLRINQVLLNILSNAVKYTPNGGKIEMRARETRTFPAHNAKLSFLIRDNGMGMTQEYLKTIFEPFTREQESIINTIQGTGLGMSITKSLVELMGGSIYVRSKKGKGTVFLVRLELDTAVSADYNFWKNRNMAPALLLEPSERDGRRYQRTLAADGLQSIVAANCEQALEILENASGKGHPIKLLFARCLSNGPDSTACIKLIGEKMGKKRPIIIVGSDSANEKGPDQEIDAIIQMPFLAGHLRRAMEEIEGKHNKIELTENSCLAGRHVLIVDDNEMNSDILSEFLEMIGIESDVARNGKECLTIMAEKPPELYDAILMDVQMPIMNGYEATKAFRSSDHPRAHSMPIIAMTANTFAEDVRAAHDSGMDAHVAKPVDIKLLQTVLMQIMKKTAIIPNS